MIHIILCCENYFGLFIENENYYLEFSSPWVYVFLHCVAAQERKDFFVCVYSKRKKFVNENCFVCSYYISLITKWVNNSVFTLCCGKGLKPVQNKVKKCLTEYTVGETEPLLSSFFWRLLFYKFCVEKKNYIYIDGPAEMD